LEMRAKGVQPTRQGGFGYLRGPDGAMIENAQAGTVERFNHVHMYHEHPRCAMEWYAAHLGAKMPQGRGAAPSTASGQAPAADAAEERRRQVPRRDSSLGHHARGNDRRSRSHRDRARRGEVMASPEQTRFLKLWENEDATTRKVLARIPEGSTYRPDPKSRTAR